MDVSLGTIVPNCEVYYTLDGTMPTKESLLYRQPITLTKAATITARAYSDSLGYSFPVEARFIKST